MLETTGVESHKGWTVKTRSAAEIKSKIAMAKWGDELGQAISGSKHKRYRYFAIRYRLDEAYISAYDSIMTTPTLLRYSGKIMTHPNGCCAKPRYNDGSSMFDVKARTRLGLLR